MCLQETETLVPPSRMGWDDPDFDEEGDPNLIHLPTFCIFGPQGEGGVYTYHLLIEEVRSQL